LSLASPLHLFFISPRRPAPTLFPYTSLFRSQHRHATVTQPVDQLVEQGDLVVGQCRRGLVHRDQPCVEGHGLDDLDHLLLGDREDRKSTRLNSSHVSISYAVFCLKKKNRNTS